MFHECFQIFHWVAPQSPHNGSYINNPFWYLNFVRIKFGRFLDLFLNILKLFRVFIGLKLWSSSAVRHWNLDPFCSLSHCLICTVCTSENYKLGHHHSDRFCSDILRHIRKRFESKSSFQPRNFGAFWGYFTVIWCDSDRHSMFETSSIFRSTLDLHVGVKRQSFILNVCFCIKVNSSSKTEIMLQNANKIFGSKYVSRNYRHSVD